MNINRSHHTKKPVIIVVALLLLAALCLLGYKYWEHDRYSNKATSYGSSQTKPDTNTPKAESGQNSGATAASKDTSSTLAQAPDASVTPTQPTGTFVSNHRPNLSGSPAPSAENSTCTTTPGAKCMIIFEKDGATVSLPAQTTDANGNTHWDWDIKSLGLTGGDWTIRAQASNGDKTSSTTDELKLGVRL